MALMLFLATIFVIAWLIASWPNVRRIAGVRPPLNTILTDTELGLAQVALPFGWLPGRNLNDSSWLQAVDPLRNRYFVVISESREDFDEPMDLREHSARTRRELATGVRVLAVRGPEERQVNGFRALQYELDASTDLTLVTYLHTTIEGRRAFHQVLAWATRSWYDRAIFERMLDGFEEVSGPDPRPIPVQEAPVEVPVTSRYDVH